MNEVSKLNIEKRIEDWIQRINNVFFLVKETLGSNSEITFIENKTVQMHEELMQKYNIKPINLPILEVRKNRELLALFQPVGLWVVGANGRIDILTKKGSYILVDSAKKNTPSNWKVFAPNNRKNNIDFNKKFIQGLA